MYRWAIGTSAPAGSRRLGAAGDPSAVLWTTAPFAQGSLALQETGAGEHVGSPLRGVGGLREPAKSVFAAVWRRGGTEPAPYTITEVPAGGGVWSPRPTELPGLCRWGAGNIGPGRVPPFGGSGRSLSRPLGDCSFCTREPCPAGDGAGEHVGSPLCRVRGLREPTELVFAAVWRRGGTEPAPYTATEVPAGGGVWSLRPTELPGLCRWGDRNHRPRQGSAVWGRREKFYGFLWFVSCFLSGKRL